MEEIIRRLKELIEEIADIPQDEIEEESALMDDLELSSLEVLSFIAAVEDAYKLKIPERSMRRFVTVEDVAEYVWDAVK